MPNRPIERPIDDPVGFAIAMTAALVGAALICLVGSILGGVIAAPFPWLEIPSVQGLLIGLGIACIGWEIRWFMNLAKRNRGEG